MDAACTDLAASIYSQAINFLVSVSPLIAIPIAIAATGLLVSIFVSAIR